MRAFAPITRLDQHLDRLARNRVGHAVVGPDEPAFLSEEVARLRTELEDLRRQNYSIGLLLGPAGRGKSRLIDVPTVRRIAEQVQQVTGCADGRPGVVQAYRLLFELELRGVGRLAGGVPNILGKLATTPLLEPPNGELLEIGTLFGIFAGGLTRQLNRVGIDTNLTIVDPFTGGQVQNGRNGLDPSGSPVTEVVARANLTLAGVPEDRIRVVTGYSESADVRTAISDRTYGVIVVDGDHSAAGVAADLELAETIASVGGVVVLDDYGDKKWPGVEQAVTAHLAGRTRFELLGSVATSAFLRAR